MFKCLGSWQLVLYTRCNFYNFDMQQVISIYAHYYCAVVIETDLMIQLSSVPNTYFWCTSVLMKIGLDC